MDRGRFSSRGAQLAVQPRTHAQKMRLHLYEDSRGHGDSQVAVGAVQVGNRLRKLQVVALKRGDQAEADSHDCSGVQAKVKKLLLVPESETISWAAMTSAQASGSLRQMSAHAPWERGVRGDCVCAHCLGHAYEKGKRHEQGVPVEHSSCVILGFQLGAACCRRWRKRQPS